MVRKLRRVEEHCFPEEEEEEEHFLREDEKKREQRVGKKAVDRRSSKEHFRNNSKKMERKEVEEEEEEGRNIRGEDLPALLLALRLLLLRYRISISGREEKREREGTEHHSLLFPWLEGLRGGGGNIDSSIPRAQPPSEGGEGGR